MHRALAGLTVIDFGQYLAAPMVSMVLADLGADVIRIDPPTGPLWDHQSNAILQRGKKSITLDLHNAEQREIAQALVDRADIVIESFRPGGAVRLGLDGATTTARNKRLIHLSLPGFAADDPRASLAAWDGLLNTAAGFYLYPGCSPMNYKGDRSKEPIFSAIPQASFMGALVALHTVAAALYARERSGAGQHIDMSLYEASFELVGASEMRTEKPKSTAPAISNMMPQLGHYQGSDGEWLELCLFQDKHLEWFARDFMPQEWIDDGMGSMDKMLTDTELQERARARFTELIATRPARDWEKDINNISGASAALSQSTLSWLHHDDDARANEAVIELTDPEFGKTVQAGYPVRLSETPAQAQGPRHALDSDRAVILDLLNRPVQTYVAGPEPDLEQALSGIRVIDTAQVLAGPTTSRILAEYGAEVIKIHSFEDRQLGMHPYTNSGKLSMMLNLKTPDGLEIFEKLARGIDVFVQNFTRGVADRIGIGEARLRELSPELIYTSISAFGYDGYRGGWRGREQLGQGVTGMQVRLAGPGNEPIMAPYAYCDYSTGNFAAFGTIIALYHRIRGGKGQSVHTSLSATGSFLQLPYLIDFAGAVHDEPSGPDARGRHSLDRLYPALNGWFYLAATAEQIGSIETATGLTQLIEMDEPARADALTTWSSARSVDEAVAALTNEAVAAHRLVDLSELMDDQYAISKGLVITRDHPGIGKVTLAGPSPRMTKTPARAAFPVGAPGADTRAVLMGLGYSAEQVDAFVAADVVREGLPNGAEFIGLFR